MKKSNSAFTLAELLIALMILGEIATFTIPKILTSQQTQQNNAKAKEIFSTVAAAYQVYTSNNGFSGSAPITAITQYMNYLKVDSSSTLDGSQNDSASYSCGSRVCLKMQNGATVAFGTVNSFGGTNTTNMQWFLVDPDGAYGADASSVWGILYYNGRVTTWGTMAANSRDGGGGPYNPGNYDPAWFSW